MSGIAAVLERGDLQPGLVQAMLARLAHRGPDRAGTLQSESEAVGIAQCALDTTVEDTLDPVPLRRRAHDGGELWIAADARIDVREGLLEQGGAAGEPASDAELILRAYERWGEDCTNHLVGDYAFVIWDARRKRLVCARDPVGVRHLYYRDDAHGFRCASEMAALFADSRVPRRVDLHSMRLFLAYRYDEQGDTLWEGVRALAAGHRCVATRDGLTLTRFWAPSPARVYVGRTPADRAEQMRATLTEAVRCRLRSRSPVAANLSGGLDSSSVVSLAARLLVEGRTSTHVTAMRLSFPGLECDERRYSDAVVERWNLPVVTCEPLLQRDLCRPDPAQSAGDVCFHPSVAMREPMFDAAAERGIRTMLTGLGSDQLMHQTGFECASLFLHGRPGAAFSEARAGRSRAGALRRVLRAGLVPLMPSSVENAVRRLRGQGSGSMPWLSPTTARAVAAHEHEARTRESKLHKDPATAHMIETVTHGSDVGFALARVDRHAARRQVEERHPFFDVRVVDLLLAFPCEERFDRGLKKPVLRRAMAGTLPSLIQNRRHPTHFGSYIRVAMCQPFREEILALLRTSKLAALGLIDAAAAQEASLAPEPTFHLPNMLGLELWLRHVQQ